MPADIINGMVRRLLIIWVVCWLGLGLAATPAEATNLYRRGAAGIDVSWPNCHATPPTRTAFGIVGVTAGKNFTVNPCLPQEARWFSQLSLYTNTAYPGIHYGRRYSTYPRRCPVNDTRCLAYNYGYNAGRFAADTSLKQGVLAPTWWLDVETINSWTMDAKQNRQSLAGMLDALTAAGARNFGFYSQPAMWQAITNNWRVNLPNWVASGQKNQNAAVSFCKDNDFTGGGTELVQYLGRLDQDVAC